MSSDQPQHLTPQRDPMDPDPPQDETEEEAEARRASDHFVDTDEPDVADVPDPKEQPVPGAVDLEVDDVLTDTGTTAPGADTDEVGADEEG